jgi:predicted esterase YcpF (UPF0227 family)
MALTKLDIQALLTASEERVSQKFESKIDGVAHHIEQNIRSATASLEERLTKRIDKVETCLEQKIESATVSLEGRFDEKIASESKILQLLFNHVLKSQEILKAYLDERFSRVDNAITKANDDQEELCDDVVELQSDVEQLKIRVFGVK